MNVDAGVTLAAARDAADARAVAIAAVDVRREPARDLAPHVAELQRPEAHRDGVRIVRVIGLAFQFEGVARSEPRYLVLAALEAHAHDLREEVVDVTDRGKAIAFEVVRFVRE